jgi:hypothetical protein
LRAVVAVRPVITNERAGHQKTANVDKFERSGPDPRCGSNRFRASEWPDRVVKAVVLQGRVAVTC